MSSLLELENWQLESGCTLDLTVAYHVRGRPKADGSNIVWVIPTLTAGPNVFEWWPQHFGVGRRFCPESWAIISVATVGANYGSSGPASWGQPPQLFPRISIRDLARVNDAVGHHLQLPRVALVIGASVGGMVALEWAIEQPEMMRDLILIGSNAAQSPFAAAANETQRMAIEADTTWSNAAPDAGSSGLQAARAMAIHWYRGYAAYKIRQPGRDGSRRFLAADYQRRQGSQITSRLNAACYLALLDTWDTHDISRDRGTMSKVLRAVRARTLILSLQDDPVCPVEEQIVLSEGISGATHRLIPTRFGHDGVIVEHQRIGTAIDEFLAGRCPASAPTCNVGGLVKDHTRGQ